ncbi:NFX1-type zinc finger-containing protein [Colletotrichum chrysophilum]|uniref:NFX1-type zinc finger-containing protein n=1 Tax=Colletotrichum chrysophilum TaxID=1836956 RepID=A0AAD9EDF6_9PEZI|nr:NFX1-type zinc finger-containing protein [Colletotrichum chrysophilum]
MGLRCPYARVTLTRDGARFASPFCKIHCCKKIDNGAACTNVKTNSRGYCTQHLLCTGIMNGQRCTNYVKSYDPKEYQFCAQFHNCLQQGCKNERTHQGDVDLRYCQDHRCVRPDCTSPRAPGGSTHCASHTCAAPACFAACPGASGDPHDPSRFCDRHRMCHTAGCRQFAHVRADGVPSKHCGAHYCRWEAEGGCDGARDPMSADGVCGAHTCVEAGCLRARDHREEGAQWCKDHTCKSRDCRWRRWLGEYCREHQCGRPGCPRHGEHNNYCDRHRACTTPGCDRFRRIDGENIGLHCEEHSITRCRREGCDVGVVDNTELCASHLCSWRPCRNERALFGSALCAQHKCAVPTCPHRRTHMNYDPMYAVLGGDRAAELLMSAFCNGHACRHEQCPLRAEGDTHFCRTHARCRRLGCTRVVELEGEDPTICLEHNHMGPRGMGRRGALGGDPYGNGHGNGGWPGGGVWGVNAAI